MNLERRTTNLDGLDEINKKASNSSINLCREKSYSLAIFDPIILPADYHQKNSDSISLDMTNVSDAQYKKKKPVNKSSSLALHSTRRTIHQVSCRLCFW